MLKDFDMIVHELPRDYEGLDIVPIGDVHVGSDEFDLDGFEKLISKIEAEPQTRVVLVGDMMDNALKNSKTNVYEATMNPFEQKEYLKIQLGRIKEKILGAVGGNHEYRSTRETGDHPLYDIMAKLDIEHLYRPNMAFIKVNVGEKSNGKQASYNVVLAHGGSKTKVEKFSYAIDGLDLFVTGHTHTPTTNFPEKIVIDPRNNCVSLVGMVHVIVNAFHKTGGYGLKNMYMPQDSDRSCIVHFGGKNKEMNVEWIQRKFM